MTHALLAPLETDILQRALAAGVLAACLCALIGCWVVLRGSVFLGDAMTHGMLPGVAVAALLGGSLMVGGLVAALAMALGIAAITRSSKLASDTSIGLLLVGMLALGVIIVSRSQSFAVDLAGFLFGDVLGVRSADLAVLAVALALTLAATVVGHRAFVAATFDARKAVTLGLHPQVTAVALTSLMAVAMVATFHVVGTLLVLALLIAPTATALTWARSIPRVMAFAAVFGSSATYLGLLISWHAGTAGGATIAGVSVSIFFVSIAVHLLRARWRRMSAATALVCLAAGCSAGTETAAPPATSIGPGDRVIVDGARELDGALTKLVLVDPRTGDTSVYDAVDETETRIDSPGPVTALAGDGRFAYLGTDDATTIVDAGSWTFDHGDHYHYFATEPAVAGVLDLPVESASASNSVIAVKGSGGAIRLLDRDRLGAKESVTPPALTVGNEAVVAVPYGERLVTVTDAGLVQVVDEGGTTDLVGACPSPTWSAPTRRAVVFGCATGAIRVTGGDADLTVTDIPFPTDAPAQKPIDMDHRDRADVFAGVSPGAVWVLDSRQRNWATIPVADAVAANTSGNGTVLVLHRDGTLSGIDVNTKTEEVRLPLFERPIPTDGAQPVVDIDTDRAYVNDAAARQVYEIDYGDGLRLARTLRTDVSPGLMVETGR